MRRGALAAGAGLAYSSLGLRSLQALGYKSPNERLNIAGIGAGGQAFNDLRHCESENIIALADVDRQRGQAGFKRWEKATQYDDFRRMLDKEHKNIDAVVIAIPDHMHATAALWCMQLGLHVYLEKPLTRTAWEARFLTQAAEKYRVATQMGNQGYSHDATRVACEILWSGEIGDVREVHAWTGAPGWPQGMPKIPPPTPVPDTLNWDSWLGGAAFRPYTAGDDEYRAFIGERFAKEDFTFYLPSRWRGFSDFGSGLIGDWGIHILGPANWALQLGPEYLLSVECIQKNAPVTFSFPDALTLKYEFAARPGGLPPVTVYWYHHPGGDPYTPPGMTIEESRRIAGTGPQVGPAGKPGGGYNCIFAGSKGYLGTSGRGEGVGLLPGSRWAEYKLPAPTLARSPGAARVITTRPICAIGCERAREELPPARISVSQASYTEWLILGAAAVHYEGKLLWDNARGEFSNNQEANQW